MKNARAFVVGQQAGNDFQEELVLRPAAWPLAVGILLAGSVGGILIWHGNRIGWFCALVATAYAIGFIWCLSPHSKLRLSPAGFRFGRFWRVSEFQWSDIAAFSLHKVSNRSHHEPRVGFNFSAAYRERAQVPPRVRRILGITYTSACDGYFPDRYGLTSRQLIGLLEEWRTRNAGGGSEENE